MLSTINIVIFVEENLPAYLIFRILVTIIVNAISMVLLRKIPPDNVTVGRHEMGNLQKDEVKENVSTIDEATEDRNTTVKEKDELIKVSKPLQIIYYGEYNLCQLMKVVDFHWILWPFVMSTSVAIMYTFSLEVFLKSFDLIHLQATLVFTGSFMAAIFKFGFGLLSDFTLTQFPRVWYLMGCVFTQVLLLLCCFIGDYTAVVILTNTVQFVVLGAFMAMTPIILSDNFGTTYFASIWGTVTLFGGVGNVAIYFVMGVLYNGETEGEDAMCYGLKCFRVTFIISTALCIASLIMLIILYKRQTKQWDIRHKLADLSVFEDKDR